MIPLDQVLKFRIRMSSLRQKHVFHDLHIYLDPLGMERPFSLLCFTLAEMALKRQERISSSSLTSYGDLRYRTPVGEKKHVKDGVKI